jgi:hypothetical protein
MNRDIIILRLRGILNPLVHEFGHIGHFGDHSSVNGPDISWFEMFCRSSWGIIAYTWATSDNTYLEKFRETLLKAIADKRYAEFKDYDQKAVELVPVAVLLLMFRKETWDVFSDQQRRTLIMYFENVNNIRLYANNWVFFRLMVCSVLQKLTGKDYGVTIAKDWRFIDKCYQGEGWFRDGLKGPEDYYNAWGFHFYSLLYYFLFDDTKRKEAIKERSLLFARQYQLFFDEKGRSIAFGRSLTYRYASLSFWSMMLVNNLLDEEEAKWAEVIISNNFEWWNNQQVYDKDGFQSLGYAYSNRFILEGYSSSGSVYWSLKAFMLLLTGKESAIWKEKGLASREVEHGNYRLVNGKMVISSTPSGNVAYINLVNRRGMKLRFANYLHFAYHSATGFNVDNGIPDFGEIPDDSSLVFAINGQIERKTDNLICLKRKDYIQKFIWRSGESVIVFSTIVPLGECHARINVIHSRVNCTCYETGFAVNSAVRGEIINSEMSCVINDLYNSAVLRILGDGIPVIIHNGNKCNLYNEITVMPSIKSSIKKGNTIMITLVGLTNSKADEENPFKNVKLKLNNNRIEIRQKNDKYVVDLENGFLLAAKALILEMVVKSEALISKMIYRLKVVLYRSIHN